MTTIALYLNLSMCFLHQPDNWIQWPIQIEVGGGGGVSPKFENSLAVSAFLLWPRRSISAPCPCALWFWSKIGGDSGPLDP